MAPRLELVPQARNAASTTVMSDVVASCALTMAISVSLSDGSRIIKDGRVLRVPADTTLLGVFELLGLPKPADQVLLVKTSSGPAANRQDAELTDDVGLHCDFGRRFVFFRFDARDETPSASSDGRERVNALAAMMDAARQATALPDPPRSGAHDTRTGMDRLIGDLTYLLRHRGLGFPVSLVNSDGTYILRSLAKALWCIDGCHDTLANAARHKSIAGLPSVWLEFAGYYDHEARKRKKPQLDGRALRDHANLLVGMLSKPVIGGGRWSAFRSEVEGLARTMSQYSDVLEKEAAANVARQHLPHVVRPLESYSNVILREGASSHQLSADEQKLQSALEVAGLYQPVLFDEGEVLRKDMTPMQRHRFLQSFRLQFPVDMYTYDLGGSIGTMVFLWRIDGGADVNAQRTASLRVIEDLKPKIPQYHTEEMRRSFSAHCRDLSGIPPHVRRYMYAQLTGDASAPSNPDIEYRMRMVVLGELPEVAADMRHLNKGQPQKFDVFLAALEEVIQEVTAEDERRRGLAHMSHFISQRDLHQLAKDKCPPGTPVPSLDWVALQFQPRSSQCHSALKYTGRLNVRYCLQARQLRSVHEDDHYCLALFKMERAMAVEHRTVSTFVCLDDKAKVPIGEPGQPISTGVRPRPGIVGTSTEVLQALDHDQASRGSLTPSVVLLCDIPESVGGSFYGGELHVLVKDSVLEPSNPFRHATELSQVLSVKECVPPLLFAYSDGGSDHRTTFLSVQLSWILLFTSLDLDFLVAARTAPGHSYTNPAERCMSTLNLGLQNCALAREAIADPTISKKVKGCSTMDAIRKLQPVEQDAWSASVRPVRSAVEARFNRLVYGGGQVRVHEPAAVEAVAAMMSKALKVDTTIDVTNCDQKQKDLVDKAGLKRFIDTHCHVRHYSFQVKKCGADVCEFGVCRPPRLPLEEFQQLTWLPDPMPDAERPGHYKTYSELKGKATSGEHRPSLQTKATHDAAVLEQQGCPNSFLTAQRVRGTVECKECQKPRCFYSRTMLSDGERAELQHVREELEYSCGSPLLPADHPLREKVFVRIGIRCADPVSLQYYSCKQAYHGVCCYCAAPDAHRPQHLLQQYHTVLPICNACQAVKAVITRQPKAGSKKSRT